jgi:3-isopropylmalate/(R)-2-methylmalate dehydratase small subunit
VLPEGEVDRLFDEVRSLPGYRLTIDLAAQRIGTPTDRTLGFDVDPFRKASLLNGWDDIALSLRHADEIRAFESARLSRQPWLA